MPADPLRPGEKVLVTGGAGFLGSHLAEALAKDHEVAVLDDLSTGRRENLTAAGVALIRASVLDRDAVRKAVEGCAAVFHLAARTSVPESLERPKEYSEVNVGGTVEVLEAALQAGARRFVLASSSAVYGDTGERAASEDLPLHPLSPYAATKTAAELVVRDLATAIGAAGVSLRFFNVYGPRQRGDSPYASVIPRFVEATRSGTPPTVYGDGEQTRDFLHVRDAMQFFLAAATAPAEKVAGRVFNAGSGTAMSVNDLLRILAKVSGRDQEARHSSPRPGDIRHSRADLTRSEAALGVRATVSLEAGLRELLEAGA